MDIGKFLWCEVPDCVSGYFYGNAHKDANYCDMNELGAPYGCDQPEVHHKFANKNFDAIVSVLRESDIVWPKYGSDNYDQLAEKIARAIVNAS